MRSRVFGVGVGGGEMKATFFSTLLAAAEAAEASLVLSFVFLRVTRGVGSGSSLCSSFLTDWGVEVDRDESCESFCSMGGRGRVVS